MNSILWCILVLWQYIFAANATLSHKIFVGLKLPANSGRNYDIAIH